MENIVLTLFSVFKSGKNTFSQYQETLTSTKIRNKTCFDFYANSQIQILLLENYKLETSDTIPASMLNTCPWIHHIETIIDLSTHNKQSTNAK